MLPTTVETHFSRDLKANFVSHEAQIAANQPLITQSLMGISRQAATSYAKEAFTGSCGQQCQLYYYQVISLISATDDLFKMMGLNLGLIELIVSSLLDFQTDGSEIVVRCYLEPHEL